MGRNGRIGEILFIYIDQRAVPSFENQIYSFASSGEYEERNEYFLDLVRFFKVDIIMFRCKQYWLYCLHSLSEVLSTKFSSHL